LHDDATAERHFMALENTRTGDRVVINQNSDGTWRWWKNGRHTDMKDQLEVKSGETRPDEPKVVNGETVKGDEWVVKHARTAEIEQQAHVYYYKNILLSMAEAEHQLGVILRNAEFQRDIVPALQAKGFAIHKNAAGAAEAKKNGFDHTTFDQQAYNDYLFDPRVRERFDDAWKMGLTPERVQRLSGALTKTLFWYPVPHMFNEAVLYGMARGWDWANPFAWGRMARDFTMITRQIMTQDPKLDIEIERAGGSLMTGGIVTGQLYHNMGRAVGIHIERNPAWWDPIARTLGVGPSDLARGVYDNSRNVMWSFHDALYKQLYLEARRKGMSAEDAVNAVEHRFGSYRMPTRILKSRLAQQILSDRAFVAFGQYHRRVFGTVADSLKDLVVGTGKERIDAAGRLVALGMMGLMAKFVLDRFAQYATGDEHAQSIRRGPLGPGTHLANVFGEGEDIGSFQRGAVTLSPLLGTIVQEIANQEWNGQPIVKSGHAVAAAQYLNRGEPTAALAHIGAMLAEKTIHLGHGLVAPWEQASQVLSKPNKIKALTNILLDIKEPTPKANQFEVKQRQEALSRMHNDIARPNIPEMGAYYRATGLRQ
jgi:hypothetical protein